MAGGMMTSLTKETATMTALKSDLKAKDVMVPDPVCVRPSTTLRELARVLEENRISGAPVIDAEDKVVGVVSKTDLIRRCSEGTVEVPPAYLFELIRERTRCVGGGADDEPCNLPEPLVCVADIMTTDSVTVVADTPATYVARLMFQKRIHRVVVVDQERFPLGIITSLDLLGAFAA